MKSDNFNFGLQTPYPLGLLTAAHLQKQHCLQEESAVTDEQKQKASDSQAGNGDDVEPEKEVFTSLPLTIPMNVTLSEEELIACYRYVDRLRAWGWSLVSMNSGRVYKATSPGKVLLRIEKAPVVCGLLLGPEALKVNPFF